MLWPLIQISTLRLIEEVFSKTAYVGLFPLHLLQYSVTCVTIALMVWLLCCKKISKYFSDEVYREENFWPPLSLQSSDVALKFFWSDVKQVSVVFKPLTRKEVSQYCMIFTILLTFLSKSCNTHYYRSLGLVLYSVRSYISNFWNQDICIQI